MEISKVTPSVDCLAVQLFEKLLQATFGEQKALNILNNIDAQAKAGLMDAFKQLGAEKLQKIIDQNNVQEVIWALILSPASKCHKFLEVLEEKDRLQILKNLAVYHRLDASLRDKIQHSFYS